jgi:hypothetical protein
MGLAVSGPKIFYRGGPVSTETADLVQKG